jgi:hypothetical protein
VLNIEYRLKLGQDEFVIRGEYKTEKEFFNQMSFFSSLPKAAPGGSTDLKLVVRETKKGKYYSIVSEKEKLEFQLGQHKEGDTLYAKDWVPLYQADADLQSEAPVIRAPAQQPKTQQAAPVIGQAPAVPNPNFPGLINPVVGPSAMSQAPTPMAAPVSAPTPQPPAAQPQVANPQVQAVANNVLARFGINK